VQPDRTRQSWWIVRLTLRPEAEEPVSTVLWDAGTVGISSTLATDPVTLTAYFADRPDVDQVSRKIETFLTMLNVPSTHLMNIEEEQLVQQDWLHQWKEGYHPIVVGERFIIAPSWEKPRDPDDRIVIEIDPGMAFGTGTHATTQLCLLAIEQYWRGGRFLDIGTGTGILAIAAAKLRPDAKIVAVDTDPIAIEVAGDNLMRNHVAEKIELRLSRSDELPEQRFDLIAANLTADILEAQIGSMGEWLTTNGILILSGVLVEQEALIQEKIIQAGLCLVNRLAADEWVALVGQPRTPS
jgi:ribosomal protein L11 methyltransferase